jgi:hypothetical protein
MRKLCCLLLVVGLSARNEVTRADDKGAYMSVGLGRVALDFDDATFKTRAGAEITGKNLGIDFDSATPIRLGGGYSWGTWALEMSYEHVFNDVNFNIARTNATGSLEYGNFNIGGVYRSTGQLYFLGKLGISQPATDTDSTGTKIRLGTSGFVGAGLGFRFSRSLAMEFDFSRTSNNTSTFMLGLRHQF